MFEQFSLTWRPVFSVPLLLFWLAAGLVLVFWQWRSSAQAVRRSYRLVLQGMRILGLLLFFLFLMQPAVIRRSPEKGAFRLAVLADQSRSMDQVDLNQTVSRRRQLEEILQSPALADLAKAGEVEFWGFSEEPRLMPEALRKGPLPVLPGGTGLGLAMEQTAAGKLGARPLGAMLILSDGRWNEGKSPVEAAKQLALRKIPVSCVGIGAEGTPRDVQIQFLPETVRRAEKNQPYTVEALVRNDFDTPQDLTVELLENSQPASARKLRLGPGSRQKVLFAHRSLLSGMRSLSVRVSAPEGDFNHGNNVDFLPVEIREADQFRILYLASSMHWEWRFLKINAENNEQLKMAAVIRTGEKQFFHWGLKPEVSRNLKGFPENTEIYADFDAVLADAEALRQLSPDGCSALSAFVEHRGGGLLITGAGDGGRLLPDSLASLCPVLSVEESAVSGTRFMTVLDELIFPMEGRNLLHSSRGIPLYGGIPVQQIAGVKKAARVLMQIRNGRPVMAAQSYGAGRCVYLGLQQTWQWRMREDQAVHEEFWNHLLVWLAANQTPQLEVLNQNCKVPVDVQHELRLRVSGMDFRPSPDAAATALITDPGGRQTELPLNPALDQAGLYLASFRPAMPGEYAVRYRVRLPEDKFRETSATLLAVLAGREVRETRYHEELLRDVARITGGKFYSAEDFPRKGLRLPLSEKLPMTETEIPVLFSWWMMGLIAAVWAGHWWMRRRIGLK